MVKDFLAFNYGIDKNDMHIYLKNIFKQQKV